MQTKFYSANLGGSNHLGNVIVYEGGGGGGNIKDSLTKTYVRIKKKPKGQYQILGFYAPGKASLDSTNG
jgi:hypothetical protein